MDLYRGEKQEMVDKHILDRVFLALSREPNVPKVRTPCCFIIIIIALVVLMIFDYITFNHSNAFNIKSKYKR